MNDMISGGGENTGTTPVMAQYREIKAAHPGCLLFYRMGDFYELFFADAELAAGALGIILTKRGKHNGEDIPMCGVPVHAADSYLQRLIRLGHRVAVCEQLENPAETRKRGSKAIMRRAVVRLVTPGTLTEESLLDSHRSNYLAALSRLKATGEMALAWADISSGALAVMTTAESRLAADLARLDCRELILADYLLEDVAVSGILQSSGVALTPQPASRFDSVSAGRRLMDQFGVAALDGFGAFTRSEIASLGGLIDYVKLTQAGQLPHLRPPRREEPASNLLIDAATRTNLEIMLNPSGGRGGSLLSSIDMTVTAGGARLLAERLANPLTDAGVIASRLDEVDFFRQVQDFRDALRALLRRLPDIGRALGRLTVGRGGPRDLDAIRKGFEAAARLAEQLRLELRLAPKPPNIAGIEDALSEIPQGLAAELSCALAADLPMLARDGGFVRIGYHAELDRSRELRDATRDVIAGLQAKYIETTGIKPLKIRHNNILGYFIEIPAQHAALLQDPERTRIFIHRQTVANAMRFTTTELGDMERRIDGGAGRALAIELEIFANLVDAVSGARDVISRLAEAAASLDVATALAEVAVRHRFVRPRVDHSTSLDIRAGRHPVVESVLREAAGGSFVANDCNLSGEDRRLWLLTGPNMAGKSTFLRQNALIIILAQMGSFVPADSAHIGIVDRLFSRVGAADDLARGRSTFMVEMVETAAILNQATERSFVILDEIGRGTATFDGLSIAWAAVEHLHEINRCRALFATHYHELTGLASRLKHLANATVRVREWHGDVVFLHEVVPGVADRSYGIQVARLAGLPASVLDRAEEVLQRLERSEEASGRRPLVDDLPLFSVARPRGSGSKSAVASAMEKRLAAIAPDELSPRDALELIYELKARLTESQS